MECEMRIDLIQMMDIGYDTKPAQLWPIAGTGEALDRTKYVTASEVGQCMRMVKYNKLAMLAGGYVPEHGTKNKSSDDWGFFERGHTMETWIVDKILDGMNYADHHLRLVHTGGDQLSFVAGQQSGTPDGVFLKYDEHHTTLEGISILEAKSIDPRTAIRNLPKKVHVDQVLQNMDLVAHHYGVVPLGGELLYVDASDYKRRYSFFVEWDRVKAENLEIRAQTIMDAPTPEDLPAEGIYTGGCTYCAHTAACSDAIAAVKLEQMKNRKLGTANDFASQLQAASTSIFNKAKP